MTFLASNFYYVFQLVYLIYTSHYVTNGPEELFTYYVIKKGAACVIIVPGYKRRELVVTKRGNICFLQQYIKVFRNTAAE